MEHNYLMHFGRSKKDDPSLPIGTGNWQRDGSGGAKAEYKASKLDRKAAAYQRKAAELKRKSTRRFRPIDSEKATRKAAKYELKASKYSEKASKIRTKEAKENYRLKIKADKSDNKKTNSITEYVRGIGSKMKQSSEKGRMLIKEHRSKYIYASDILSKEEMKELNSLSIKHDIDYMLNRISNHELLSAKIKDLDEAINKAEKKDVKA